MTFFSEAGSVFDFALLLSCLSTLLLCPAAPLLSPYVSKLSCGVNGTTASSGILVSMSLYFLSFFRVERIVLGFLPVVARDSDHELRVQEGRPLDQRARESPDRHRVRRHPYSQARRFPGATQKHLHRKNVFHAARMARASSLVQGDVTVMPGDDFRFDMTCAKTVKYSE